MNFKKRLFILIHTILIIGFSLSIYFLIILTPYQDWNLSLKLIDYDKYDVSKVAFAVIAILNGLIAYFSKRYSKIFWVIHLILAVICALYFSWLLTLV